MASSSQQQQAETPAPAVKQQDISIQEMTRLMDVAAALRKERLTAEQQLNIGETKKLLRERLLESAGVSGDPVTEQEIDAAIDAYYERQHEFKPPAPGIETFLASVYVRRAVITKVALAVAAVAALWWSVFAFGLVGEKRTERMVGNLYNQVEQTASAVEEMALTPDVKQRVTQLRSEAKAARDAANAGELQAIQSELESQAAVLKLEYTIVVVSDGPSGRERLFTDDSGTRTSGYFLIVQAEDAGGKVLAMPIRDSETNKTVKVKQWGEQVPEEVFNRLAADKQSDGVLDDRVFAEKQRGQTQAAVRMVGDDGEPLARGRQITQW